MFLTAMEESLERSPSPILVKLKSFSETFNFSAARNRIFFLIHKFAAKIHYAVLQLNLAFKQSVWNLPKST